jgi:hypothetical protein
MLAAVKVSEQCVRCDIDYRIGACGHRDSLNQLIASHRSHPIGPSNCVLLKTSSSGGIFRADAIELRGMSTITCAKDATGISQPVKGDHPGIARLSRMSCLIIKDAWVAGAMYARGMSSFGMISKR